MKMYSIGFFLFPVFCSWSVKTPCKSSLTNSGQRFFKLLGKGPISPQFRTLSIPTHNKI